MANVNLDFTYDELFLLEMALDEVLWRIENPNNPTYQRYRLLEQKIYSARTGIRLDPQDADKSESEEADDPIESLNFSLRTYNILKRSGVNTVGELTKLDEGQLWSIKNMTKTAFKEITRNLFATGYTLAVTGSDDEEF